MRKGLRRRTRRIIYVLRFLMSYQRSISLMTPEAMALLVVDLQQRLVPAMFEGEKIVKAAARLVQGAVLLGVPVLLTEQYPKGLGPTVSELSAVLPEGVAPMEKRTFSCCESEELMRRFRELEVDKVLLCGVESHVCILQTALDLLGAGFEVYLAVDAVGSRRKIDYRFALRRLDSAGATLTTVEAALFEWCRDATHPKFKEISALVK